MNEGRGNKEPPESTSLASRFRSGWQLTLSEL